MKNLLYLTLLSLLFLGPLQAQDVTFTFTNAQNTNDGADDFYEVDVLIESVAEFKLGAGLLYFNYNTAAFGTSIFANGNITITYPNGTTPSYLLGSEALPGFGFYNSFITNDNTTSRVAFSWQQALSSGMMSADNVTGTAAELFHMRIKYVDVNQDPSICFESGALFQDQTFTACGGATFADCVGTPGVQITDDNFDCSGASLLLPVELITFTAKAEGMQSRLDWMTASESNNEGFVVQRLEENEEWISLDFVRGQGTTNQAQQYSYYDKTPGKGINYYRLKQMDFDSSFEYSEIQAVEFQEEGIIVEELFPNPSIDGNTTLKIWIPNEEITSIRVYDLSGRLYQDRIQNLNAGWNSIDFQLDAGHSQVYLIQLNFDGVLVNKKLVVGAD